MIGRVDDLLEQRFRARTSLAAYREAYAALEGEVVISLEDDDLDDEPERPSHRGGPHTQRGPAKPGHVLS